MKFKDYYKIMGVAPDASQEDIKRAYRKLARKYHPDVSKEEDAEERFKEVNEAYEVLKDPEKRAAYDELRAGRHAGEEFTPPPGWNAGFEFSGGGFTGADASQFSDFFESLFGAGSPFARRGGRRGRGFSIRGEDHHAQILIPLEDSYHGATRNIQLQVPEYDEHGRLVTHRRNLKVKIPRGITEGQYIRLAGQGAPGIGDAPRGDLYLEVNFKPHPLFRVDGRDIYINLPVTPWEAALGARVRVPTLGGWVDMKVPAGTQSGARLRLKGRGLPGSPPGDQYAIVQIVTPEARTEEARRLYERMARELAYDPRAHWERVA
ncbi:MAG TPA: J domain-containing protein [Gammaproteobacteria bacterium]|nr:J domain-containing protein [Gammaproteobacteria bacterium]